VDGPDRINQWVRSGNSYHGKSIPVKAKRKSIRLTFEEDQLLRTLHRQSGVPDGQFPQRPKFWRQFTNAWNAATGRTDTPEDVLHYIMTKRKKALWFRFGADHKPLPVPEPNTLTAEQWEVVDAIYVETGVGADNFLVDRDLRSELLKRFMARTGVHIPELLFTAALIARRKGGWLPKVPHTPGPDTDVGFGDIDQVG